MTQKKVCMLGGFAVGKTSLVSQFVSSIFSDKYHTTVGVKVDKKVVSVNEQPVTLMLWDVYGQDEFQTIQEAYLRGSAGYLLVVDGTRPTTLQTAFEIQKRAEQVCGRVPFVLVLNKADLSSEWQLNERALWQAAERGWPVVRTSAKTGSGVEETFLKLSKAMLGQ